MTSIPWETVFPPPFGKSCSMKQLPTNPAGLSDSEGKNEASGQSVVKVKCVCPSTALCRVLAPPQAHG